MVSADRREGWASIDDPVLRDRIVTHLDHAPEYEQRLRTIESHFAITMAKLDGMTVAVRVSAAIIIAIAMGFAGGIIWYAKERNADFKHFSDSVIELASAVKVLAEQQKNLQDNITEMKREYHK